MAEIYNFDLWEDEIRRPGGAPNGKEQAFLASLPPVPVGRWHLADEFRRRRVNDPMTSLEYAQAVQLFATMLPPGDRLTELLESQERLDDAVADIRGERVYIRLEDGGMSGDVVGYGVYKGDDPMLGLRVCEINSGAARRGGMDSETGLRLTDERFVPVLAVHSLMVLPRRTTREEEKEGSRGIISPFRKNV